MTINFYNEINNPQQRGMLRFFDRAFLAKNIEFSHLNLDDQSTFIYPLSELISFMDENLT